MPKLILTTSRKTSNRVRTFVRDLSLVLPEIDRFNRGGMGLSELKARISQTGAIAALIVSIWKGNPGEMIFVSSDGNEQLRLKLDSTLLRREVNPGENQRIQPAYRVFIKTGSSGKVHALAKDLASLLNLELFDQNSPLEASRNSVHSFIWFEDAGAGKILWTHYTAITGVETGPRIRIMTVRRQAPE